MQPGDHALLHMAQIDGPPSLVKNGEIFQPEVPQIVQANYIVFLHMGSAVLKAGFLIQPVDLAAVNHCIALAPDDNIVLLFGQAFSDMDIVMVAEHIVHTSIHLADIAVIQDDLQIGVQNHCLIHIPAADTGALVVPGITTLPKPEASAAFTAF